MVSAQVCGLLGLIGIAIFVIGGKQDNDGQGTNPSIKKPWETAAPSSPKVEASEN